MHLLQTVAVATSLLLPYVSSASISGSALQAIGARAQPVENRGVTASCPSGRLLDIEGKVQYFAGTNAWWLGHLTSDDDLDTAMSEIAQVCPLLASWYERLFNDL